MRLHKLTCERCVTKANVTFNLSLSYRGKKGLYQTQFSLAKERQTVHHTSFLRGLSNPLKIVRVFRTYKFSRAPHPLYLHFPRSWVDMSIPLILRILCGKCPQNLVSHPIQSMASFMRRRNSISREKKDDLQRTVSGKTPRVSCSASARDRKRQKTGLY